MGDDTTAGDLAPADLDAGERWCRARSLRGSALEARCTRPEGHEGNHAAHGEADGGRVYVARLWDQTGKWVEG